MIRTDHFRVISALIILGLLGISTNGYCQLTWVKYPGNPVLTGGEAWEGTCAGCNSVVYDGSIYHMWYVGLVAYPHHHIGYATSYDGINWQKSSNNPVLSPSEAGAWDDAGVYDPSVIFDGTIFHMWYIGNSGGNPFTDPVGIGYATSEDGVNWTKYTGNPVLTTGSAPSWDQFYLLAPRVILVDSTFHMWYSACNSSSLNSCIGYAVSNDGVVWEKYPENPVLERGELGEWDNHMVCRPYILVRENLFQMWYGGVDGSFIPGFGYAESKDGVNWIKYYDNPIIEIGDAGEWDDLQIMSPVVHFSGEKYLMWYLGSNAQSDGTGLAISTPFQNDIMIMKVDGCVRALPILANDSMTEPRAIVRNNGLVDECNVQVSCRIDSAGIPVYLITKEIDCIKTQTSSMEIPFEKWRSAITTPNEYYVYCYTSLATDEDRSNDTVRTLIEVSNLIDDFESDFRHWRANDGWGISTRSYHSAAHCLSSTVSGNYENNANYWAECVHGFDLTCIEAAHISFWTKYLIEQDHDFGYLEVSIDGGFSWHQLGEEYNGIQTQWIFVQVPLDDYCGIGYDEVRLRFHFVSDSTQLFPMYGWNIDDVQIFGTAVSVVEENSTHQPKNYVLSNNYPNPFNPVTTIHYTIPQYSEVRITIFNALGQEIVTLVNKYHTPGQYKALWDGRDRFGTIVPAGVYIYKMEAGDFVATNKMICLK